MDNLDKLESLLAAVDTKSTIEDFVASFEVVVRFVEQMKTNSDTALENIKKQVTEAHQAIKSDLESGQNKEFSLMQERFRALASTIRDGIDGRDGAPGPVGPQGPQGPEGKQGEPGPAGASDTPDEIVDKVNISSKKIAKERVDGLADIERIAKANAVPSVGVTTTNFFKNGRLIGRAKNINFIDGVNEVTTVQIVGDTAYVTIAPTGGGGGSTTFYTETPSGAVNGINKSYTTVNTITTILSLAINGQVIHPSEYTVSGAGFTMGVALDASLSGTSFTIVYA